MGVMFVAAARRDRPVGRLRRPASAACSPRSCSRRTATSCRPASCSRIVLVAGLAIGTLHGLIITKVGMPSFVVTLAGLLAWNGVVLLLIGSTRHRDPAERLRDRPRQRLPGPGASLDPRRSSASSLYAGVQLVEPCARARRRASRPSRTADRRAAGRRPRVRRSAIVVARRQPGPRHPVRRGRDRRRACSSCWTYMLNRTRFGRHIYAVGGNAEAARRAGINVDRVKIVCFALVLAAGGAGRHHPRLAPALGGHEHGRRLRRCCTRSPPR